MFDLGLLQMAAPASPPVPLPGAAASPDAWLETGAAFDAALAATLALVAGGSRGPAPGPTGERVAHAEWLLAQGFTLAAADANLAATDAAPAAVDGLAKAASEDLSATETADAEDIDASGGPVMVVPGDLAMPPADAKLAEHAADLGAFLQPTTAAAGDGRAAGTTTSPEPPGAPDPSEQTHHARLRGVSPTADPAGERAVQRPTAVQQATRAASASAQADAAAMHPSDVPSAPVQTSPAADGLAAVRTTPGVSMSMAATSASNGVPPIDGARGGPGAGAGAPARLQAHAVASASHTVVGPGSDTATASPGVSPSIADAVLPPATAPIGASAATMARTDAGASGAGAARGAVPFDPAAGRDAAASGGDEFAQGQPRQSPESMRFAAALAQVSPAASGDTSRAQAPVVTPVAAAAPAAPVGAATPVAPLLPAPPADAPDAENVGRLVQAMRISARAGAWEATVRLKPEHLGEITIALRVDRNMVSAVVNAEAAGVRQWLESQEQAVRSGMAEHGLQLERFLVQRDGQRRHAQPQEQERRRHPAKPQGDAAERFEIVV